MNAERLIRKETTCAEMSKVVWREPFHPKHAFSGGFQPTSKMNCSRQEQRLKAKIHDHAISPKLDSSIIINEARPTEGKGAI